MSGDQKSSSEILNELFSTFNSTYKSSSQPKPTSSKKAKKKKKKRSGSSSDSDVDKRLKKSRKEDSKKEKKKKKHSLSVSPSTSPVKKKKKLKVKSSSKITDDSSVPIGDGFVILKKSKVKEVEDGEIIDDGDQDKSKRKRKDSGGGVFSSSHKSSGVKKLSASQAYKLDEEEKLLTGYDVVGSTKKSGKRERSLTPPPSSSRSTSSSSRSYKTQEFYRSSDNQTTSSSSSSSRNHRGDSYRERSRSPKPRLAPPRESYRNSYMKFQKQREYEEPYHHSSSRSYDTAGYYDYHAERSRETYDTGRSGFGYVGKSYYYDDVQEENGRRESSRESRDRDRRDESRSSYGTSSWRHRHRSRSKSPLRRSYYHPDDIIDKTELLEIARKNAKKLMKSGVLPSDIFSRDQILALKAGGKSVDELTKYCKRLARRDAMGDATDACGSDSDDGEGSSGHFIHHPFQVKDKPLPTITLNIRNAVPLPVRTPQQLAIESVKLRSQFPVSSGTQHRFQEIEWKPVKEDDEKKEEKDKCRAVVPLDDKSTSSSTGPNVATVAPMMKEIEEVQESVSDVQQTSTTELKAIEAPPPPPPKEDTGISVDGPGLPAVDIGSVIGLRLKAMRMLQENPGDGEAKVHLDEATKMMKHWADAKALEPKFLTPAELSGGPQAWAKRDQLRKTRAINSGMGMHLLQKMGWKPGEGLGKNNEGQLEPLALDVKTDKKGLTAAVEELMYGKSKGRSGDGPSMPVVYDLSGKHPVSALMELTAKRRWGNPEFELCFEHGPPHKRQFVYKVIVNGIEYQPCVAVGNKKQAKANAAAFCLQSLGLLPSGCSVGPGELLQTVGDESGGGAPPQPVPPPPMTTGSGGLSGKFGAPTYLQTVQVPTEVPRVIGPQDPSVLMPPPPVPPPIFK